MLLPRLYNSIDQPAGYYRFSETGFTTVPYPIATNLGAVGPAGNGVDATSNPEPGITKGVAGALNDRSPR